MAVTSQRRRLIGRGTGTHGEPPSSPPDSDLGSGDPGTDEGPLEAMDEDLAADGEPASEPDSDREVTTFRKVETRAKISSPLEVVERGVSGGGFLRESADDMYGMDDPLSEEVRLDPTFRKLLFDEEPSPADEPTDVELLAEVKSERLKHPAIEQLSNRPGAPKVERLPGVRGASLPPALVAAAAEPVPAVRLEPQAAQDRGRATQEPRSVDHDAPTPAPSPTPPPVRPEAPRPVDDRASQAKAYGVLAVLGSTGVLGLAAAAVLSVIGAIVVVVSLTTGDSEPSGVPVSEEPVAEVPAAVDTPPSDPVDPPAEEPALEPTPEEPIAGSPVPAPVRKKPKPAEPTPVEAPAPEPVAETPPPPPPEPEPEPEPETDEKKGLFKKKKK